MADAISFGRTLEFLSLVNTVPINVSYKHFWKSVSGKNRTHLIYRHNRCIYK